MKSRLLVCIAACLATVVVARAVDAASIPFDAIASGWELGFFAQPMSSCCSAGKPSAGGEPPSGFIVASRTDTTGPLAISATLDTSAPAVAISQLSRPGPTTFSFSGSSPVGTYRFTYDPPGFDPITARTVDLSLSYSIELTLDYAAPPPSALAISGSTLEATPFPFVSISNPRMEVTLYDGESAIGTLTEPDVVANYPTDGLLMAWNASLDFVDTPAPELEAMRYAQTRCYGTGSIRVGSDSCTAFLVFDARHVARLLGGELVGVDQPFPHLGVGFYLTTNGTLVPEPSTALLLGSGIAAVAQRRRRMRATYFG